MCRRMAFSLRVLFSYNFGQSNDMRLEITNRDVQLRRSQFKRLIETLSESMQMPPEPTRRPIGFVYLQQT